MAVVTKAINPDIGGYITLQGDTDTIIINKINVPDWVHDGFKLMVDFDQPNIGAGVWLKSLYAAGVGENIRLIPFGFNKANVMLDSGMVTGKDSIDYIIDAVNEIIISGGGAAAALANAVTCNNAGKKPTAHWHEVKGLQTVHGIKGSGAVPSQGQDFTYMYPVYTFVYDASMSVWKQTAFAFNNFS